MSVGTVVGIVLGVLWFVSYLDRRAARRRVASQQVERVVVALEGIAQALTPAPPQPQARPRVVPFERKDVQ